MAVSVGAAEFFLSPQQVAELYGVPRRSVYYAIQRRLIRGHKLPGGGWIIHVRDLPKEWPLESN